MTESEATVFVVDDDPLVRESLKRLMESVGPDTEILRAMMSVAYLCR